MSYAPNRIQWTHWKKGIHPAFGDAVVFLEEIADTGAMNWSQAGMWMWLWCWFCRGNSKGRAEA